MVGNMKIVGLTCEEAIDKWQTVVDHAEFGVGIHLSDLDANLVIKQLLLIPQLEELQIRRRVLLVEDLEIANQRGGWIAEGVVFQVHIEFAAVPMK